MVGSALSPVRLAYAKARPLAPPDQKWPREPFSHCTFELATRFCGTFVSRRGKLSWIDGRVPVGRYRSLPVVAGHKLAPDRGRLASRFPPDLPRLPRGETIVAPDNRPVASDITTGGLFQRRKMSRRRFFTDRLRRTQQISLDPVWRMNRLWDDLFLVLSHICITSIHDCT
jgi:hypothetical protein